MPRRSGELPSAAARSLSRRRVLELGLGSVGLLAATGVGIAVAEADRDDGMSRPLYTEELGEAGPLLAFLPGLGATSRYWHTSVRPLARSARLVLVDLLGFGRSPKPWTTYSLERHVAELRRVLEPHGPLILVGHSLGARLAVAYATRHPEQVERLILVSLPYFGGPGSAKAYIRERPGLGWIYTHMIPTAILCLLSRRVFGWLLPYLVPDQPREVVDDLLRMTWRSSTSTLWEVIYGYDLAEDLARLPPSIPMVCLHGDHDTSAPLASMRALAATRADCELRILPGGDHDLPTHSPMWTREEIAQAAGLPV